MSRPVCSECGSVYTEECSCELDSLRSRINELESQLPDGMRHCTIVSKECEKGHGWLTATNWVDFPCPTCQIEMLRERRDSWKARAEFAESALKDALNDMPKRIEGLNRANVEMGARIGQLADDSKRLECLRSRVKWILNDACYKAPEQIAGMWWNVWEPELQAALTATE